MKLNSMMRLGFLMLLFSTLWSCSITKIYTPQTAGIISQYRGSQIVDSISMATRPWHTIFRDTMLQQLLATGIKNNLDLQTAFSQIRQAEAYYRQSSLTFYPSLDVTAGANFNTSGNASVLNSTASKQQFQTQLTASWETDIWGKLKSAKKAQLAALLRSEANARAVQTTLVANIALNYYYLMALDRQLAITRQSVINWQSTVDIMKKLKTADVVTGAAVVQSEASKYAVTVTIPDLQRTIWQTENIINLLIGHEPGHVVRGNIDQQQQLTDLDIGVPAQLLANRPDVQAAELTIRYNFELINVARAYFYPALTINGTAGFLSNASFFSPGSLVSSLAAGLTQPIFNKGANLTRLRVASEQKSQALFSFKTTLLTAAQEISNALMSYRTGGEKAEERQKQLDNLNKAVNYTQQLVRFGTANYTEVLTAQQSLLNAQLNQVNDHLQQLQAIVYLYRALGGGWQ